MANCKECDGKVDWRLIDYKWQCFNAGTDVVHWDTCSQRKTAAIVKTGEFFENKKESGYYTDRKASGVFYMRQSGGVHKSKLPIEKNCGDCVPPWEVCCDCPNSLAA